MTGTTVRGERPAVQRAPSRTREDRPLLEPAPGAPRRGRRDGRPAPPAHRAAQALALVVLTAGLVLTGAVSRSVRDATEARAQRDFELAGDEVAETLRENLVAYTNRLRNVGSFLANAPRATPEQFRDYLRSDHTFEDLDAVQGLVFITRVQEADLGAFTARMRTANPDLELRDFVDPEPGSARYIVTNYVAGPVDLQIPLGYNIAPVASVRELVDRAAAERRVVATALHEDRQLRDAARILDYPFLDELTDVDLFLGVPVFGVAGTAGEGLTGWVGAPVSHFSDLLADAAHDQRDDIGVDLRLDVDAPGSTTGTVTRTAELRGRAGAPDEAGFRREHRLDVNGLSFGLTTWRPPTEGVPFTVPLLVLGGSAASVLAAAVLYLRVRTVGRERGFADELADGAEFQRAIVDSVLAPLVVLDHDGAVLATNRAGARLLGGAADDGADVVGTRYLDALATVPAARDALATAMRRILGGRTETVHLDLPVDAGDERRWYAVRVTPLRGRRGGAVVLHRDVTERKQARDALELRASRDPLTGLSNRSSVTTQLERLLAIARRRGDLVGALFIDLDRFKPVNDTLGHATGDAVLQAVAARVAGAVRPGDLVGRLGGDEFVVVMAPTDPPGAERAARRVLTALADPIRVDGEVITQGASVGVAVVDPRTAGSEGDDLLERADRAMYRSKERGGSRFTVTVAAADDERAGVGGPS